jgi:hypothetical protein
MGYTADTNLALALGLEGGPASDAEIRRLVGVARILESVPDPDIDPGFAARLEARLMTEDLGLVHAIRPTPRPDEPIDLPEVEHRAAIIRFPRRRFMVRKALAATIAAALALALPVVASAGALPGSPGYGLKLRIERMRLAAANGLIAKAFVWLDIAENRLSDAQQLSALHEPRFIPVTLDRLEEAQRNGASLILAASTDREILARVAGVLQSQGVALQEMLPTVPSAARDDLLDAIRTGQTLSLRVAAALGLPMIRPPATATPGATAPDQPSVDSSISSDGSWGSVDAETPGGTAPRTPGIKGSENRDSDATYMRCKVDPYRGPGSGEAASVACPESMSIPEPREIIHIADRLFPEDTQPSGSSSSSCPNPKTCRTYQLKPYRWATSNGLANLSFSINPAQHWMTTTDARNAVLSAMRVWNGANPNVRFLNTRTTDRIPTLGDGYNDIGWVPLDPGLVAIASIRRIGSRIYEADVKFNALLPWTWTPCSQRSNSCTGIRSDDLIGRFDVQAIATHEIGHAVGIAHLENGDLARDLSMYAQPHPGERKQATLALGDVLAIRAAYPYKGRPLPPVYAP